MSWKRIVYFLLVVIVAVISGLAGVAAGSLASQAGLYQGDMLTRIGDVTIDETHSFFNALFQYQPGDVVPVSVVREAQEFQVEVKLGESDSS